MWIPQQFQTALSTRRRQMRLNQQELAALSGVSRSRISQLENGIRFPNKSDLEALTHYVPQLPTHRIPAEAPGRYKFLYRFQRERGTQSVYSVPKRLFRLMQKYPDYCQSRLPIVEAREDRHLTGFWMGYLPTDSCDELIPWIELLNIGAVPRFCSLAEIDFNTVGVIDTETGVCRLQETRPCLEYVQDKAVIAFFAQIPLLRGTFKCRVDILAEVAKPRNRRTFVIETDGSGHDSTFDQRRDSELGLPVLRFSPSEMIQPQWCERLIAKLLDS